MVASKTAVSLLVGLLSFSSLTGVEGEKLAFDFQQDLGERSYSSHGFSTLLIGINYVGTSSQLNGCIRDVERMAKFVLTPYLGVSKEDMIFMTDYSMGMLYPTAANIRFQIKELVRDLNRTKQGFFHYSGHGSHISDYSADEWDGRDEILCPIDIDRGNYITDDEMFKILVQPLNADVKLTVIADCCHSGTILDLPYKWRIHDGSYTNEHRVDIGDTTNLADVVMISGCKDDQTSADGAILTGESGVSGAMTVAYLETLRKHGYNLTYRELLNGMHSYLVQKGFSQRPELTSTRMLNLDDKFMTVTAALRG